ncbi:MAG: DinB family protein [Deinococcales bacterium]|nr:DinB family protein [Chitinophagaceae bacterium]
MTTSNQLLIKDLLAQNNVAIDAVNHFLQLPLQQLNHKPTETSWCILECIEHLNLYSDYYLPEIEKQIKANSSRLGNIFKSGIIGNYFANLMLNKNGKQKALKAPKDKTPVFTNLSMATLDTFIKNQERFKQILLQSQALDLTNIKISISLTKIIKLRLGDTLRFVTYHNTRHIQQAEKVLQ